MGTAVGRRGLSQVTGPQVVLSWVAMTGKPCHLQGVQQPCRRSWVLPVTELTLASPRSVPDR